MKLKLFPFDKVEKNSKIIIYGMGQVGQRFIKQVNSLSYCNIVCCIDKRFKDGSYILKEKVFATAESINKFEFDYIVIATIKDRYKTEIESLLIEKFNIPKGKIITLDAEYYVEEYITPAVDWTNYYIEAENDAVNQYKEHIEPLLTKYKLFNDKISAMDFACGRGRIANILKDKYKELLLCDVSTEALDFCKKRFEDSSKIQYIQSESEQLKIQEKSLDLIYSWDAMVHFNYKMLDTYISEFSRLLKKDGYCIIHHSNLEACIDNGFYDVPASENFSENIHWRAKVSKNDVKKIAHRNGFIILEQIPINWGVENLDCITVLRKI